MAVPRWDTFPCLRKPTASVFSLGENSGGESHWWECAKPPAAPCRPWVISQWPQAQRGSCTPTRCLCGTWRSSSSALPVGGCGNPAGGVSPTHPSLKNTLCAAESSSSSQGFEPSSATTQSCGNAGTEVMLLGNGPLRSGRDISGRAGAAPRSRSRGRSSAVHHQRSRTLLWTVHLQLLHVLPWQSSWDGKQPLCLCAGVQGTEQCEIIQPFLGAAVGC